ncbi:MAG: TlpA family protein disulfide reductase [Anaerolineae bacterium]|nr:TlpA family protein disulfide reductase [Anaerolineae bacterium]
MPEAEGQSENVKRRPWWVWPLAILAGALIGYAAAYLTITLSEPKPVDHTEYAPAFALELFYDAESLTLDDLEGRGVVLNFWASWCLPCQQEMPALEAAWQKYAGQGVVFVGANIADERQDALDFLAEYDVTYPNGVDMLGDIQAAYSLLGYPTTWFIKPDGSVARKVLGPLNLADLDDAIALILPE